MALLHCFPSSVLAASPARLDMPSFSYKWAIPTKCHVCTSNQCLSNIRSVESRRQRPRFVTGIVRGKYSDVGWAWEQPADTGHVSIVRYSLMDDRVAWCEGTNTLCLPYDAV